MFKSTSWLGLTCFTISVTSHVQQPGIWGELKQMEHGAYAKDINGWVRGDRVQGHELVHPIFMLRHSLEELEIFEQVLWAVSTPGSPRYGQHLSRSDVAAQLPPVAGAKEAVIDWLNDYGIKDILVGATGDIIEASMPAKVAEEIFSTELHHFRHSSGVDVIRAVTPHSVPEKIAEKLYVVGNLPYLPRLRLERHVHPLADTAKTKLSASAKDSAWHSCDGCHDTYLQPAVLQEAYGFGPAWYPEGVAEKTSMAVASFQGISYDMIDLGHFQDDCHLNFSVEVSQTVGFLSKFSCHIPMIGIDRCDEALLDVEYIKAVGGPIPLSVVSSVEYSYLRWIKEFDDLDELPHVISISYGTDEILEDSKEYMNAVNAQFMKLGVRGASVLVASGDQGTYGRSGETHHYWKFHPDFPASSPYVTSVGGTDFVKKGVIGEEKAWKDGGGGFSNTFKAPPYQQEAVKAFINRSKAAGHLPPQKLWNEHGRGYPDVAALGGEQNPYCIQATILTSQKVGIAGTSASCPVTAGIIARLNAHRIDKGGPPMGFLNPWIYQNADAFNDVTQGRNPGETDGGHCGYDLFMLPNTCENTHGFHAEVGWDPTTGVGTPNFPKLLAAALGALTSTNESTRHQRDSVPGSVILVIVFAVAIVASIVSLRKMVRRRRSTPMDHYISIE